MRESEELYYEAQKRRIDNEDFKKQVISLCESGKSPSELIKEYNLFLASVYQWRKKYGINSNV